MPLLLFQPTTLLLILLLFILALHTTTTKQLYMSHVFRHGSRYSVYDYYDYNQTKQFNGQLTSIGLRQHFLLGSFIQNQYAKNKEPLMNATLKTRESELFSMTTASGRCEESAYAQAFGVFPFSDGEKIPNNFDPSLLEPPFETIFPSSLTSQKAPQNLQNFALLNGFQPSPIRPSTTHFPDCPNLNVLLSKRGQQISKDLAIFQTQQSIFTDKMRLVFNLTMTQSNVGSLQELADTLMSDKWVGREMPKAFTDEDYRQIYYVRNYMLTSLYAGEVAQVVNAPFVNILLHNMQLKIEDKLGVKKFSSISVHQNNIIPLLTYYNITSAQCLRRQFKNQSYTGNCADGIPFSSNLIFELHQNDTNQNQHFVKVRYNGVYYKLFGKNTTEVDYTEFQAKSKQGLKDFRTECKVKVANNGEKEQTQPQLAVQ